MLLPSLLMLPVCLSCLGQPSVCCYPACSCCLLRVNRDRVLLCDCFQAEKTRDAAETTEKFGLEAGLWQVFTGKGGAAKDGKGKGAQAKDLLARYGSAYLITSISFAILSFGACYALVSSGAPGSGG